MVISNAGCAVANGALMMGGGGGVASTGGGGHVGITIYEKPPAEAALAVEADKRQEVAVLYDVV